MSETLLEHFEAIKEEYQEAFCYISGDILLMNPTKAFEIFSSLSDKGFVAASFYCGLMLCMGFGIEKNFEKGKGILKSQEKYLGYVTEVVIEQSGLFGELTIEEKLKCIDYWKHNHQTTHALVLQANT